MANSAVAIGVNNGQNNFAPVASTPAVPADGHTKGFYTKEVGTTPNKVTTTYLLRPNGTEVIWDRYTS